MFPIVNGCKVEYLHANLEVRDVALTPALIRKSKGGVPFETGVPHNLMVSVSAPRFFRSKDRR